MKHYKYKLNMLEPGGKLIKVLIVMLLVGILFRLCNVIIVSNVFFGVGGVLLTILIILLLVEQHQDKVLNAQQIYADSILDAACKKQSFSLSFRNTEIWHEHLDGFYDNQKLVMSKFRGDIPKLERPSCSSRIAVNVEETLLTTEMVDEIINTINNLNRPVTRVAFVGVNRGIRKYLHQWGQKVSFQIQCENDYEHAKEWLAS